MLLASMKQLFQRKRQKYLFLVMLTSVAALSTFLWIRAGSEDNPVDSSSNSSAPAQTSTESPEPSLAQESQDGPEMGLSNYTSPLGISFQYPSSWKLTDNTSFHKNDDLSITLESKSDASVDNFSVSISIFKPKVVSQYPVSDSTQMLVNELRLWTFKKQWSSRYYNSFQEFECPSLRLLSSASNIDIPLKNEQYLSSEASFCHVQDSYATKTYEEQLQSEEWQAAVKMYSSIQLQR